MNKDYQGAIQILSEALNADASNMEAKFYRALSYLDSGLINEAVEELNGLLQSSKDYQ